MAGGSGRPAMARMCSSNWLAGQASIVQWPELCGRGAISFTSTRPSRSTNISTASKPDEIERIRDSPSDRLCLPIDRPRNTRWRQGQVENMVAVAVLDRVEGGIGAILVARRDDADLQRESR